jgi:hypothetical protein
VLFGGWEPLFEAPLKAGQVRAARKEYPTWLSGFAGLAGKLPFFQGRESWRNFNSLNK